MKKGIRYRFGDKLRRVRERKGVTLREVAEQVEVSESLISQIERNKVSPSIDTLLTLAGALEIDLEYLFRDYKKDKKVDIVRKAERKTMVRQKVTIRQLSALPDPSDTHAVEAFLMEIAAGGETGDIEYGHIGKELGIILEGEGELVYGTQTYSLRGGDSVSFPSDIPHILRNIGKSPLKAIWVISPPRMLFSAR